ncbi:MAG TPA: hypothetical protein VK726_13660 [Acetobacteraceae bacterium]|nr:hypothetical protein [Acetobacteraceae bacterium]
MSHLVAPIARRSTRGTLERRRAHRWRRAQQRGIDTAAAAGAALGAGAIGLIAAKDGLRAFVEVKARPRLADATPAPIARGRGRRRAAAEIVPGERPGWGAAGVRPRSAANRSTP